MAPGNVPLKSLVLCRTKLRWPTETLRERPNPGWKPPHEPVLELEVPEVPVKGWARLPTTFGWLGEPWAQANDAGLSINVGLGLRQDMVVLKGENSKLE